MIRSILITKSKYDKGALYDYCISQNIAICYHSFLTFKQVNISETTTSDVLFFSSKRAVDYFLQQTKISENTTVDIQSITCLSIIDYMDQYNTLFI